MEKSKNAFYQKVNCPTCGNEIVVFESDGVKGECVVEFCDKPDLG